MSDTTATPQDGATPAQPQAAAPTREEVLRQATALYREAAAMMPPATVTVQPARQPDFVDVRLTAAAIAFIGPDASVHIANGFMAYTFTGSVPQRVVRLGEWTKVLSAEKAGDAPMFEIVPDDSTTTPATT